LCLGCFLCALLSKTVACSLPAAILLLQWWKRGRVEKRDVLYAAPLFLLGFALAFYTVVFERHQVGAQGDEWTWSFVERVLIAGRAVWFYAGKLVWPANLTFIYSQWDIRASSWSPYLFPGAAAGIVTIAWSYRSKWGRGPA